MNEMVGRVMRSLYEHWRQHYGVEGAFEKLAPTELEFGEKQARAAIAAMREPTEAILIAISDDMDNDQHPLVVWGNAIDAALSE